MSQLAEMEYLREPEISEIDECNQCQAEEHYEKTKKCTDCGCLLCVECGSSGGGKCDKCKDKQPKIADFGTFVLVSTDKTESDRQKWLNERRLGIGGSDVAAILGKSKFKTPLQVYMEKINEYDGDFAGNEPVEWGERLESIVRQKFSEILGKEIKSGIGAIAHNQNYFMRANIDGLVEDENAIVEIKTSSEYRAKSWLDQEGQLLDMPEDYLLQCLHNMHVFGSDRGYIGVLIGGNKFR